MNVELREITKSHLIRESPVMISATIPSAKYSCSDAAEIVERQYGRSMAGLVAHAATVPPVRAVPIESPQLVRHIGAVWKALAGIFLQTATDNALEIQASRSAGS